MPIPTFDEMFNPLLLALHALGGSGSIDEIEEKVAEILQLSDEDIITIHKGNRTQLSYRLAWTRSYLKRNGLLENSTRGIWSLTPKGVKTKSVDGTEIKRTARENDSTTNIEVAIEEGKGPESQDIQLWEERLLTKMQEMPPDIFERLCQRVLREAGFVQVEVTGRSGDGGIDGVGIIRIGGFLSFHIIFQCKRYTGSITAGQIRDFRGAMQGRGDKGLFITTGTFTRDAKKEATRDGAPPIDLIDGDELVRKMKELNLGVHIKTEEAVVVDNKWFENFS
jgi:restriction system protein